MGRWIEWDRQGGGGDALGAALDAGRAMALLPAEGDRLTVVEVTRNEIAAPSKGGEPAETEASGFLGLDDRIVFGDEKK